MQSNYYLLTFTVLNNNKVFKNDPIVNYFKFIKNGKPLTQFKDMLNCISDPSAINDEEILNFILNANSIDSILNFFNSNETLKQKICGLLIRMKCSKELCENMIDITEFSISDTMIALRESLKKVLMPIILKITVSDKSRSARRINSFKNLSVEEFDLLKYNEIQQCRKINKFAIFSVKNDFQMWAWNRMAERNYQWNPILEIGYESESVKQVNEKNNMEQSEQSNNTETLTTEECCRLIESYIEQCTNSEIQPITTTCEATPPETLSSTLSEYVRSFTEF